MLETPKALSTKHSLKIKMYSENLKDVTMDNQQETKKYKLFLRDPQRLHAIIKINC